MVRSSLIRLLHTPPFTGSLAALCGVYVIGVATAIRWAVNGVVTGCEFTPYLPFVLLAAILMRWWQATVVAAISIAVLGGLLMGSPREILANECFLSSAGIFLASSVATIGAVVLIRRIFAAVQDRGADEAMGGIVFSLEQGQVWASWYGQGPPVLLGSQRKVTAMMDDFLRQERLGRRLNGES